MTVPPLIQLIHASDAPHHAAELKSIMMRMKSENRISDLLIQDIALEPFSLSLERGKPGGIVILLTHEVEQARRDIEQLLMNTSPDMRQLKLIEIIVDNVPYNNHFISFPQDLKPIRSREDMNLVWKGIEEDLEAIFPKVVVPEVVETKKQPFAFKKYLTLFGISVLALLLCNGVIEVLHPLITDEDRTVLNLFSFVLPAIIFLRHKRDLEQFTLPTGVKKSIDGALNWRQLLVKSGIALLVLLVTYFGSLVLFVSLYIDNGIIQPILAVLVSLLFVFYKRKAASVANVPTRKDSQLPPAKRFFKFFGALFLYFLVSAIFWVIIVANFFQGMPERDTYTLILAVITTFFWMFFRERRRRTKTPA